MEDPHKCIRTHTQVDVRNLMKLKQFSLCRRRTANSHRQ